MFIVPRKLVLVVLIGLYLHLASGKHLTSAHRVLAVTGQQSHSCVYVLVSDSCKRVCSGYHTANANGRKPPGKGFPEGKDSDNTHENNRHAKDMSRHILVVHWGRRAGHVVYLVDLEKNCIDNIVTDELEVSFLQQMCDVLTCSCEKVVDADYLHTCQTNVHDAHWPRRRHALLMP